MATNVKLDGAPVGGEITLIEGKGNIQSEDVDEDLVVLRVVEEGGTIITTPPGHPQETVLLIAEIMIIVPDPHQLHRPSQRFVIPWNHDRIHPRISILNQGGRIPLPLHDMILDENIRLIPVRPGIMMITVEVNTILEGHLPLTHYHQHIPLLILYHHLHIWIRGDCTIEMDLMED